MRRLEDRNAESTKVLQMVELKEVPSQQALEQLLSVFWSSDFCPKLGGKVGRGCVFVLLDLRDE